MKNFALALVAFVCIGTLDSAYAKGGGGNRASKRIGLTVGIGSDPAPNMVGFALRVNLTDFLQIHGGYGMLSFTSIDPSTGAPLTVSSTALGGGARLFIPGFSFSPFVGFNYSHWSATGSVDFGGQTINAGSGLPGVMYVTFGVDWQTSIGFNIGAGAHYLLSPTQLTQYINIVPHAYIGLFL